MPTIHNYVDVARRRRTEEAGEAGFSLIELIIVVVILGILVAIAIPVFGAIQKASAQSAVDTAAANGAASVSAALADQDATTTETTALAKLSNSNIALTGNGSATVDGVCVTATPQAAWTAMGVIAKSAGPGC